MALHSFRRHSGGREAVIRNLEIPDSGGACHRAALSADPLGASGMTSSIMIPVTSFAGQKVAESGLGGSGLASCHALKAGGAEGIAGDDGVEKVAQAAQAGFNTA